MLAPGPVFDRLPIVDLGRGLALSAMAAYHFAWDLEFFGLADLGVTEHMLWTGFARTIAASFLALVGIGLVLGHGNGVRPRPFLRRLALIAAAAFAISGFSAIADPDGIIWFGILHCIAVSSVLALPFLRLPTILVVAAGMAAIAAPHFLTSPLFNGPAWLWLGLAQDVIPSNDYNPLLPWFGHVLFGIAFARIIPPMRWPSWRPHTAVARGLCYAGRHSLIAYLMHQPILMGLVWTATQIG
jgi:uncharacterized membrane protein